MTLLQFLPSGRLGRGLYYEKGKLENYSAADCKHHHSCYHRTEHRIVREMTPPSLLKAVPPRPLATGLGVRPRLEGKLTGNFSCRLFLCVFQIFLRTKDCT